MILAYQTQHLLNVRKVISGPCRSPDNEDKQKRTGEMLMKRGDMGIALVLLVAVAWFGISKFTGDEGAAKGTYAVIEVNGKHYETVAITEESRDIEIRTERGSNLLSVSRGGIEMVESDCPDQLCIGFGHIQDAHDTIVCLPNRVFVEVIGEQTEGSGPDAVVN